MLPQTNHLLHCEKDMKEFVIVDNIASFGLSSYGLYFLFHNLVYSFDSSGFIPLWI